MGTLTALRGFFDTLSRYLTLTGGYMVVIGSMLVVIEVFERKLGTGTIKGADELSGYALAIATAWSFSYAFFRGSHIRIDALYRFLPLKLRATFDVIAALALFLLAIVLAYWGAAEFMNSFAYGGVANTVLRTPLWIPQLLWLSGLLLFAISTGVTLVETTLMLFAGEFRAVHRLIGDPSVNDT